MILWSRFFRLVLDSDTLRTLKYGMMKTVPWSSGPKQSAKSTLSLLLKGGFLSLVLFGFLSCRNKNETTNQSKPQTTTEVTAKDILGNKEYPAISYGGYRKNTREIQPTIEELKEDMRILHELGIRVLRTYNVHLPHASNLLKAIRQLRQENAGFEMYVMLGAWIDCKNAWTDLEPDHYQEGQRISGYCKGTGCRE